jgi:BirA family transcriptional regulator, biotin operon repressor / biotin---[acetyl-CoA-carboxylase] ligase
VARHRDERRRKGAVLTISRVAETGSTNTDLLAMAARGDAHEGDWLVADRQTAGRGRQGRVWASPQGNFYGSTLVALRADDPPVGGLSLATGLGLCTAIGDPATLKWPNDVLINGAKVAGVLLERTGDSVVIGFGINLVSAPDIAGRKTTTIDRDGPAPVSRDAMFERLVTWVSWAIDLWRTRGTAFIARQWQDDAHPIGTPLSASLPDGTQIDGTFDGLDDDGAMRLCLADGTARVIHAGDVFLI